MAENFPKLMIGAKLQIQEVQKTLNGVSIKANIPNHIIFKLPSKELLKPNNKKTINKLKA